MNKRIFGIWRSGIALLLVLCLVAGMCPTVAFAEETEKLKYVSLGDSMTNGLGLPGYKNGGYMEAVPDAYPYRLSQYYGWSLTQLATSGMRAEDLHFILEYGEPGGQEADFWAYEELIDTGRWPDLAEVSANFKKSIAEADVISAAVGNANFGVYMAAILNQILGMEETEYDFSYVTMENGLAGLDAQTKGTVMGIYNMLMDYLSERIPRELAEKVGDSMVYVIASYMRNYVGAMERIIELNPDAEVIIVGLMNTMSGNAGDVIFQGKRHHIDMAEILDLLLDPLNAYLAVLPTMKQAQGEYTEATFYYAEVDRIKTLAGTFQDAFKDDETVIRDRFITDVNDSVFSMLPMELERIALSDVKAYESAYDNGLNSLAAYTAVEPGKAFSAAYYLAVENAILNSLEADLVLNLDEIPGIAEGNFDALEFLGTKMAGTMTTYQENMAEGYPAAYDVVVEQVILPQLAAQDITTVEEAKQALELPEFEAYKTSAEELATLYITTEVLQNTLESDELNIAVLNLYGRLVLANGMNAHPSAAGHEDLYNEIRSAYGNHTAKDQVVITLEELFGLVMKYGPKVMEKTWETFVTDVYLDDDFQYAAIGDGSAKSKSYVDYLTAYLNEKAAEFALEPVKLKNYAKVGNSVGAEIENLSNVSEADLITVGFSNIAFLDDAINKRVEMDWASVVGEENVPQIHDLMVQVEEKIAAASLPDSLKIMASNLVEAYAFCAVQYVVELPDLISQIREVNPEALVVIVGMSNPFKNITFVVDENTTLDISGYLDDLVTGVAVHGTACALMSGNAIYVDAPDASPIYAKSEISMTDIARLGMAGLTKQLYPGEAGHKYIAQKIAAMLNVMDKSAAIHYHTEEAIPGKAATCTEEGMTDGKKCSDCGELIVNQETIPAKGHTEQTIPGKAATCTEAGLTDGKKCSECGIVMVNQEPIAASGHSFADGICSACGIADDTEKALWGDADGNGEVQTNDAKLILQYCAEMIGEDDLDLTVSDVDGNGRIQTNDAKLILQYCAEMVEKFPVAG